MKVKTYKTKSLEEGLENIKRELGADALILGTRSVSSRRPFGLFKQPGWEITAALEEKTAPLQSAPAAGGHRLPLQKETVAVEAVYDRPRNRTRAASSNGTGVELAPLPTPAVESPRVILHKDTRMEELIGEIADLKKSMRSLSKAIPAKSQDNGGGLFAELVHQGIDHDLADHLITTASRGKPAPTELRERVRRLLADQVTIAAPAEFQARTRMVSAFVGPTGVGKTTTIAKIAGHASIRLKKKVAMISTDHARIGGQEQLNRLGELLGVPTYACADVSTLKDLVDSLDDRDLVLIDTPGSSPSDLARLTKLEKVTSVANAQVHLVVSATTRSEDIIKIVSRFKRFNPNSVIFTKMDETDSKGLVVGDSLRNELAVSYLTNGQRVPEDLLLPSAEEMARYVLPMEPAL